jgi:hypothetical protein
MRFIFTSKFYEVENKSPHHKAESRYFYCRDDQDKDYLFTSSALREANDRAFRHSEDIPDFKILNIPWLVKEKERLRTENLDIYDELLKTDKILYYHQLLNIFLLSVLAGGVLLYVYYLK